VRGDCGYGNEVLLGECEARGLPCFFKLRHTAKVKTLLAQVQRTGAVWSEAGEGWEVIEARLRLARLEPRAARGARARDSGLAPVGDNACRRRDTLGPVLPGSGGWQNSPAPSRPSTSPTLLWDLSSGAECFGGVVERWRRRCWCSATAAKRSAEPCSPRAPAAASGGGLGAAPPSNRFVERRRVNQRRDQG